MGAMGGVKARDAAWRWMMTASALVLAVGSCRPHGPPSSDSAWSLLKSACPQPPLVGRLTDFPTGSRSGRDGQRQACRSVDGEYAAAMLERDAQGSHESELHRKAGVSRLVLGEVDEAIAVLGHAVALSPTDTASWNDLAAAYLTRAAQRESGHDAALALDAASRAAILNPSSPDPLFNRSTALAELGVGSAQELSRERRVQQLARDALRTPLSPSALSQERDLMAEVIERHWLREWALAVNTNQAARAREVESAVFQTANRLSAAGGDTSIAALATELVGESRSSESVDPPRTRGSHISPHWTRGMRTTSRWRAERPARCPAHCRPRVHLAERESCRSLQRSIASRVAPPQRCRSYAASARRQASDVFPYWRDAGIGRTACYWTRVAIWAER